MGSRKLERIAHVIQYNLADILLRDVQNPNIGFPTITKVTVSEDLKHAKVHVSFLGDADEQQIHFRELVKSRYYIRKILAPRLHIKNIPELHFQLDTTWESAQRIEDILGTLNSERNTNDT